MSWKYIPVEQSIDLDNVKEVPEDVKRKIGYLKRIAVVDDIKVYETNRGLHLYIKLLVPDYLYKPWLPTFLTAYLSNDASLAIAEYILYVDLNMPMVHKADGVTIKGTPWNIKKVLPKLTKPL